MFHDTPVTRFLIQQEALIIETEAFSFSPTETVPPARIVVAGLQSVFRNDAEIPAFMVESGDAEIYGLDDGPDGVRLDLIWHFWAPRRPEVWCSYRFPGATLRIEALVGGPLGPVPTPMTCKP